MARRLVVCLTLAACGSRDDACRAGPPELVIGLGEREFVDADDGDPAPVAFGGQGGWHVWIALAARGLPYGDDVAVRLVGLMDDEEVAPDAIHWVSFRCDRREERFEAWGVPLQFVGLPEDVVGREVDVSARLALPDGTALEDHVRVVVE